MASWYQRPAQRPRTFGSGLLIGLLAATAAAWAVGFVIWKGWL